MSPSSLLPSGTQAGAARPAIPQPPTPQPQSSAPPELQSAGQAQAHLHFTQAIEISSRLLRSFWEMEASYHDRVREDFNRLERETAQLVQREHDAAARFAAAEKKEKDGLEALDLATKEKAEAQKLEAAATQKAAENKATEDRLKLSLDREAEIIKLQKDTETDKQQAAADRKAARDAEAAAAARSEQAEKLHKEIQALQAESWPSCLTGPDWQEWQQILYQSAHQTPQAALLVAAFHRFCAAAKGTDAQEISSALHDLGTRVYKFTSDHARIDKIGTALNEVLGGKFQVRLTCPGKPVTDQWMNYPHGISTVSEVHSWAVFHKQSPTGNLQITSKADVQ